ncbi:DUF2285 domain-containing protein [Sphingopyxis sp.]|uniref:transcriptional regulator domain-containing protein n=1 Tax=Sphingopyxis sp. TaxID=1908224 RepID=UPI0026148463|nr:DUF2285 domain-containing protein [Sphingopyxis sp.]MCW0199895.1 DUF2285 domain-containing protein [Sphingopyxis sp.]
MSAGRLVADWRDPAAYDWLDDCGRHAFAWEWLRRQPDFQAAIENEAGGPAARFGLRNRPTFVADARTAHPIWTTEADPFLLTASAQPCAPGESNFDLSRVREDIAMAASSEGEHWLFGTAARALRLDIRSGSLRGGPVALTVHVARLDVPAIVALARLIALARDGRWRRSHFPAERRANRWSQILRVHDALLAGASQRDIADALFGTAGIANWRINAAPWRRRSQRLVEAARRAAASKPADWLSGAFP